MTRTTGADLLAVSEAQFGALGDRIWMNTAHQGPLPAAAVVAAHAAAARKADPLQMPDDAFTHAPEGLRGRLARLVGGSPDEVVIGDSTSHGLHLVANGLTWRPGDEVVVVEGDYPATVLPFLRLRAQGVGITTVRRGRHGHLDVAEVEAALGPGARALALTWVDSFTGNAADLAELGAVCRRRDAFFVVNGSQALGARHLDVRDTPVDAVVSCGYKWLCGPYGTGFSWLHPRLRDRLVGHQAYWLAQQSAAGIGLEHMQQYDIRDLGVRGMDVFCPARFLQHDPWAAALDLLDEIGIAAVARHDLDLVSRLLDEVDPGSFDRVSPPPGPEMSTIVVLRPRRQSAAATVERLSGEGIETAAREGNVRISPHLFNTHAQVERVVHALNGS